jgi:two-component system nitrogen regulation response regulator NtrX
MSRILIIDDEEGIRNVLSGILEDEQYQVQVASDGYAGLAALRDGTIDLVVLDVLLPNMGGIDVLKEIKRDFPDTEVIMISGHATVDLAVRAVKLGAFDFVEKPLSMEKIINLVRNALRIEELKKENRTLRETLFVEDEMIGASPQMDRVRELIEQSAATDAKVLIQGENGTGKELIAREIHRRSDRAAGPFVEVNCAAIPDTLIESELFGHEKGAFTSAIARRKGKFELADGGTLFLDEIADMSLSAQAKVLRVIQELKFERIGSETSISVDVRLIAATNRDIQDEIRNGRFREDLFFRLNVVPIGVPPLRERTGDISLLVEYFLKKLALKDESPEKRISHDGMRVLSDYDWPGNIRELKNFVERITIMAEEEEISAQTVKHYLGEKRVAQESPLLKEFGGMKLSEARDAFERQLIESALEKHEWNVSRSAEALGIYPSNLHGKIRKFGIRNPK